MGSSRLQLWLGVPTEHTEARDSTIGIHDQSHIIDGLVCIDQHIALEHVLVVHLSLLLGEQFTPSDAGHDVHQYLVLVVNVASLDSTFIWVISSEVSRVNDDSLDMNRVCQFDDAPVESRATTSLRLPSVSHIDSTTGHEQVVHGSKMLVIACDGHSAVLDKGSIDQFIVVNGRE